MDVKNIYYVTGSIDAQGIYENNPDVVTIIAECKEDNLPGISYYAFKRFNAKTNEEFNVSKIKIKSIATLYEHNIEIKEIESEESFNRLKAYFTTIIENNKILKESKPNLLKK